VFVMYRTRVLFALTPMIARVSKASFNFSPLGCCMINTAVPGTKA
jgi:hypothetical protein